jgi:uncharacterized protein
MYARHLLISLQAALADTPIVLIVGARQVGKTTLVQSAIDAGHIAETLYLDDPTTLQSAKGDPTGFLVRSASALAIDEVQRAPELFPVLKHLVDRDRRPGRFILTGSANVLDLPRLSDSLAGRMEVLHLAPLAQSEIEGGTVNLTDALFAPDFPLMRCPMFSREELRERVLAGGYPEPLARKDSARRRTWFLSYITTLLQRDVRDLSQIEGLNEMPRLLALLATRTAGLLNVADLSRTLGIANSTLHRYLSLLEAIFLLKPLPAWHANLNLRFVKASKVMLNDTGLVTGLLNINRERLDEEPNLWGALLENFVALELDKHAQWSEERPSLYHFRTSGGQEVDIVLESPSGQIVGVEVKASLSVTSSDFRGLRTLQEATAARFVRGVLFYGGETMLSFGENLLAVPLSWLWKSDSPP